MVEATQSLSPFLARLDIAPPLWHRGLALYPLIGDDEGPDPLLLDEAMAASVVELTEVRGGVVGRLAARNQCDRMLLFLEGEQVIGARQNRVLNTSVLVDARQSLELPVSCVEQGRWRFTGANAFKTGGFSTPALRSRKQASVSNTLFTAHSFAGDQTGVWNEVQRITTCHGTQSPTTSLHDSHIHRERELLGYFDAITRQLPARTRGVIVAIGGDPIGIEIFGRQRLMAKAIERLIDGYALEALAWEAGGHPGRPLELSHVRNLALALARAAVREHPGVGLGRELRLVAKELPGSALVHEGLVHLSAFVAGAVQRRN